MLRLFAPLDAARECFVFSNTSGTPWDMNTIRARKLVPLLRRLQIPQTGFHSFRRFNATLMHDLGISDKTRSCRLGHASTGDITNDVYTDVNWREGVKAAEMLHEEIKKRVSSIRLSTIKEEGLPTGVAGSPELTTA
jgi:integrase